MCNRDRFDMYNGDGRQINSVVFSLVMIITSCWKDISCMLFLALSDILHGKSKPKHE